MPQNVIFFITSDEMMKNDRVNQTRGIRRNIFKSSRGKNSLNFLIIRKMRKMFVHQPIVNNYRGTWSFRRLFTISMCGWICLKFIAGLAPCALKKFETRNQINLCVKKLRDMRDSNLASLMDSSAYFASSFLGWENKIIFFWSITKAPSARYVCDEIIISESKAWPSAKGYCRKTKQEIYIC